MIRTNPIPYDILAAIALNSVVSNTWINSSSTALKEANVNKLQITDIIPNTKLATAKPLPFCAGA